MEWFVPTPDGRTLAVEDAGDRDGRPVMVHVGTPGLDWLAGFSQEAIDEVGLTLEEPAEARALFEREREKTVVASPAQAALDMQWRTPDADLALLTDEAVSMQLALAPGIEGSWDDCVAQLTPWGFDVAQITVPVLLLHGGQDRAVPFSHGQWLAGHIPGVETWFFDDEGHALREKHIEDINSWLLERSS